ncbi:hypothetical protein N656DRAFT_147733 [Canariomyces notabilis]|uniref:Uncharacterized protein n=1 Tax=Canariomyces notabilis TaxID=2074819 RepID=A0AAN6YRG4_9PEZI|nr:hypothetical protein N656DRAFT_147733 [Canariomyces arenarius]
MGWFWVPVLFKCYIQLVLMFPAMPAFRLHRRTILTPGVATPIFLGYARLNGQLLKQTILSPAHSTDWNRSIIIMRN